MEEETTITGWYKCTAIIFPQQKYIDGGVLDNSPVTPCYDNGCEQIIVVHLNHKIEISREKLSDAQIIDIVPSEDLGSMLDFSGEKL
ncbi:MAG: hypothetical protein U5K71_01715 [Gracilimonas sp.]|nr:hypothetical protein [Gracilimonas sp.]